MITGANLVRAALFATVISSTLMAPLAAVRGRPSGSPINASAAFDDGLYVDEGGPVSGAKGWLRLETNGCGLPEPTEEARILHQTGAWDEPVPDESDLRWMLFNMWLSTHPEIVVVSDGVDKACSDSIFDDDDFDPSTLADWSAGVHQHSRDPFVRESTFYIA